MSERSPANVFPPGDFIQEELDARAWTPTDLAERLGQPLGLVRDMLHGQRPISPDIAQRLGDAFGTGAQVWMHLDRAYQAKREKHGTAGNPAADLSSHPCLPAGE